MYDKKKEEEKEKVNIYNNTHEIQDVCHVCMRKTAVQWNY